MSEIREIRDGETDVRLREMNTYFFFFFSVSDSFLQEGRDFTSAARGVFYSYLASEERDVMREREGSGHLESSGNNPGGGEGRGMARYPDWILTSYGNFTHLEASQRFILPLNL